MYNDFIPVNTPLLNGNEKKYLNECIDTGWISSEGPFIKRFEEEFANKMGRKYGIAVCNGSVALDAVVLALGLKKGDEVIMPTFTIISCASAVIRAGAIPVYVDSDEFTWNMCIDQIESKITSKTKAIMVVHIYGLPVDMDPVILIAKKYGLKIIEDNSEEIGQTYKGKPCGSFGDISTFSFYPNKHVTTGEGGMIATDDIELADKCRSLRNLCFKNDRRFFHTELGFNFRMSNIQAAVGCAQLERLDEFIAKKREIGSWYNELLKDVKGILKPIKKTDYSENIYWVYGIVLEKSVNKNAFQVIKDLESNGIGARPFFWPMHEQPILNEINDCSKQKHPISENIARMGFYIPSGLALTMAQAERVVNVLKLLI